MARPLDWVLAKLPAARRAKIAARVAEVVAEEKSLHDLRRAMNKTQVAMARKLEVGQDSISRLEQPDGHAVVHPRALGGELQLVVEFPDRPAVRLPELGVIAERVSARRPRRLKRAA